MYKYQNSEASFSVFFPFLFTFAVVSLREIYFEIRRGKKDQMVNNQSCTIIRKFREDNAHGVVGLNKVSSISNAQPNIGNDKEEIKTFQKVQIYQHIKWQDLKIGDIVLLKKDETCPADILILDMFDYQCTVNTQNIDDKSDEKIKTASDLMFLPKNSKIKGNHVEYRKLLTGKFSFKGIQDSFKGLVKLKKDPIAQELTSDQFIMRGSQIQFTEWILGLVIEIGMQTYIYRKFKRPKIIYYNSTFTKKQFTYSLIAIIFILTLIFLNLAFSEINECLKFGFVSIDAKLVLSALLQLPVYYHAISEFLISVYCIHVNIKEQKREEVFRKRVVSLDGMKNSRFFMSQNYNRQNSDLNSHIHLKKESDLLRDDNFNNNTLAALKTQNEEKINYVKLNDCLTQMNDTRSIVDMCLTTHLVFNTANTLTTGQNSITGLLVSNLIYHVDITDLKSLVIRRSSKKDTLINLQQIQSHTYKHLSINPSGVTPKNLSNFHMSSLNNNGTDTNNTNTNGNLNVIDSNIKESKHRSTMPSIAFSSNSNNNLLLGINHFSNTNINQFPNMIHNVDLERVIEEERLQEQNSKMNGTESRMSSMITTNNNNTNNNQQMQQTNLFNRKKPVQSNFNHINNNNKQILRKNFSLKLEQEDNNGDFLAEQNDEDNTGKKRDNHRSATNVESKKNIMKQADFIAADDDNLIIPNSIQPSISNILPISSIKPQENDGNLQNQNDYQNMLISDTPFSKFKEDQFFVNHNGEDSIKNSTNQENKITNVDFIINDIEIEMHDIKDSTKKIDKSNLINNKQFENFVTSLEYHKKNNHKMPQLVPKKISDIDQPFPESDGEVSSPRRAKKIVKLNRSTDFDQKTSSNNDKNKNTDESNKNLPNKSKNQFSDYIRSSVARGVQKALNRNDDLDNSNSNNSGKSGQNLNKYRAGSSTLRSLANQLNAGIDVSQILESKDFVNLYTNEDSESYEEVQDIVKSMLLCHYTRSFFDEDTHKITNRSFYHIEELQLQLGNSIGYDFEFSCYIDGEFYYILKKNNEFFKYKVIAYHYFPNKDKFCILIQEGESYVLYVKEEITNISNISYLNENITSDLNSVCNYYRFQGNRTILYCKNEMTGEEVEQFIQKMEHKQNLSTLFNHQLSTQTQFLTLLAVKEQTESGLDTLFKQLKEAKIKSWIATGEKQSKVVPICFSAGILDKMHKHITFESDEYDKLAFQIRNMLQQLKDGFQKVYNTQKQGNDLISNFTGSNVQRDSNENKLNVIQPGSSGVNCSKRLVRQKSQSIVKNVRQTSRKSIVSGMELENQFRFSILVSGKSFKEIINSTYLFNHFSFICYFAQSVVGYDMTPELKAQLVKLINVKMNQNYKTMFIGDTLADFQAFTDSNISAHKKSSFNETQNYPGIQFDRVENLISLILFHSKMIAEICEDALYFNLYRGIIYVFMLVYQYQMCELDYSMINLGTYLFLSFFIVLAQTLIIMYKKYRKYQQAQLNNSGLISQFATLKQYSNEYLLLKFTKLIFISLLDTSALYFFIHFLLSYTTTLDGYTMSIQFKNYMEQYLALALIPLIRLLLEYQFPIYQALGVSFILLTIPLLAFTFDPQVKIAITESFSLFEEPQYILSILFISLFIYALNFIIYHYVMIKTFPLIKSFYKLHKLIKDCVRESFFIKPKQFNIAKLIREIFVTNEPDIILSSYILSEQVNLRETSMDKWTLKFKDQNVEGRFLSLYKKKSLQYSKFISILSFIFIEIFILYRSILYEGGSFSNYNPSFYTIYFLGAFLIFFIQLFIFFNLKYQRYSKQINYAIMMIRVVYFLIIINISDIYDSVPGVLICIFVSIIMLPLIRLDFLFIIGLLILILISFREFGLTSDAKDLLSDPEIRSFSEVHIILSHIEISFLYFLAFLLQKRNHEEIDRKNFQVNQTLTQATQKMKDTLSILLPRFIREKLYSGQNYDKISTNQGNVAILFCDITNFDEIMMQEEEKIVKVLDNLFRQFDKSCQSNQVLKIETVGKTYMAAAGLRDVDDYQQDGQNPVNSQIDPVKRCLQVAMEMQETAKNTIWGNTIAGNKNGKVEIKIGINYGTVISGVIGFHKPQFSLIGDTVNTASRVCSTGVPKTVNISAASFQRVCQMKQYRFQQRQVEAKGKGIITTYVVTYKKSNSSAYVNLSNKKSLYKEIIPSNLKQKKMNSPKQKKEIIQEMSNIQSSNNESSNNQNKEGRQSNDTLEQNKSGFNNKVNGNFLDQPSNNKKVKQRLQRKRSGTYYIDSVSKFGLMRMMQENDNNQNNNQFTRTKFNSSEKIGPTRSINAIPLLLDENPKDDQIQQTPQNNFDQNKSQQNSGNNLQKFRRRVSSIFQTASNLNIMNLNEEVIEPIHLAEQGLGVDHKIDMQKLTSHGLNLQYYDFNTIKKQYQEEKDDISQDKSNSKNKNRLQMSYWKGGRQFKQDTNVDSDEMLNDFWAAQMDTTLGQMKNALKMSFIQMLLYTITLFLMVGSSAFNLVIVLRCILLIAVLVIVTMYQFFTKLATSISLNKCRLAIILLYFLIFAVLNVEIWLASEDTAVAKDGYYLYNPHEVKELVNVLIYEVYFVYLLFFSLRIFTFLYQMPIFLITFILLLVHNICVDLIFEGIIFKLIYLQLIFTLNQNQLFQKDLENFNTLQSLNEKNQQTDKLIQYLLPSHILQRFLMNPTASYIIAEKFDKQTILFADIAGFTRYSDQNQPETVVKMLRTIFTEFDQKCQHHKVFKVYTIGDCYVILGNTNHENRDPPQEAYNVIMMAFQMIEILSRTTELVENQIDMRIGVHTGKIVGGLVGTQIVRYDIYGVDVMIANKMESNGQKGSVVVSESTKEILQERYGNQFIFSEKGDVFIKAIDTSIKTYFCDKNPI